MAALESGYKPYPSEVLLLPKLSSSGPPSVLQKLLNQKLAPLDTRWVWAEVLGHVVPGRCKRAVSGRESRTEVKAETPPPPPLQCSGLQKAME